MNPGLDYPGIGIIFLCHDGEGNFLLNLRSQNTRDEHDRWDPGGGGLYFGDGVINTLKREIKEEYCTKVIDHQFLGYRDVHRKHQGKKTHWITLDFLVHVDRRTVQNGEPEKFDRIGWFTLSNLPTPLHSQFPHFLKKYRSQINTALNNP